MAETYKDKAEDAGHKVAQKAKDLCYRVAEKATQARARGRRKLERGQRRGEKTKPTRPAIGWKRPETPRRRKSTS